MQNRNVIILVFVLLTTNNTWSQSQIEMKEMDFNKTSFHYSLNGNVIKPKNSTNRYWNRHVQSFLNDVLIKHSAADYSVTQKTCEAIIKRSNDLPADTLRFDTYTIRFDKNSAKYIDTSVNNGLRICNAGIAGSQYTGIATRISSGELLIVAIYQVYEEMPEVQKENLREVVRFIGNINQQRNANIGYRK